LKFLAPATFIMCLFLNVMLKYLYYIKHHTFHRRASPLPFHSPLPAPPHLNGKKLKLCINGDSNHGCWLQIYIHTHLTNIHVCVLYSILEMSMGNSPSGYSIPYPSPSCLIHPHTHHGYKTHPIPIPIRVSGPKWVHIPN
jgi:hypothetical protein